MEKNKKILIVDDEENIIFSISLILKKAGYIIDSAINGFEAVKKYKSFSPDIVILDIMMPEQDGYETAKQIRELDIHSTCQIIFLSAKGTSTDRIIAYSKGADDYIIKPFDNEELLDKIKSIAI